jgi:hypothetical protein
MTVFDIKKIQLLIFINFVIKILVWTWIRIQQWRKTADYNRTPLCPGVVQLTWWILAWPRLPSSLEEILTLTPTNTKEGGLPTSFSGQFQLNVTVHI